MKGRKDYTSTIAAFVRKDASQAASRRRQLNVSIGYCFHLS